MFARSYLEARQAFRTEALAAGGSLHQVVIDADARRADDGSELTIDTAVFGEGERCLVLSSGLHGVEGYTGSAVQRLLIQSGLPDGFRVVLMHALNPVGMADFRRVNENNVDLNRNFLSPDEDYSGSPSHYARLNSLLNPVRRFSQLEFLLRSGWQIVRHGYEPLKQAIAGGQYDFPKGLFWGGDRLQEGPRKLLEAIPGWVGAAREITWIDLHTGLGAPGEATYLVEARSGSDAHQRLVQQFGDRVQAWDEEGGVAYAIRGGFPTALERLFGERLAMLTCEYGTCPSVKVLRCLVTENQIVQHGGARERGKQASRTAFYPDEAEWQDAVLESASKMIESLKSG
jgi:hypothetical protein